jgi:hypothetical protein
VGPSGSRRLRESGSSQWTPRQLHGPNSYGYDTATIRRPPDTPETQTIAPAAVGVPYDIPWGRISFINENTPAPARTPVPRKRTQGSRTRPVRAHKSRSPQEISTLVDFIMAHPDSAVDAPRGQAQRSGVSTNLMKTFLQCPMDVPLRLADVPHDDQLLHGRTWARHPS